MVTYGSFTVINYEDSFKLHLHNKQGLSLENYDIKKLFTSNRTRIKSIDHLQFARLEWSDRYFDIVC